METGTGKTCVYLRTIYKLHEQYGFKKFVIVVPSVAVVHCRSVTLVTVHFPTLRPQAIVQFVRP
jgi:type III restriction enzyme